MCFVVVVVIGVVVVVCWLGFYFILIPVVHNVVQKHT